jgi:anti-sigma factor RsiW
MATVIETLDNPQQMLLLYLAGELPPEDRLEVERRLANDKSLASELDRLSALRLEIEQGIARLDKSSGLALRAEAAGRQVAREICRQIALPRVATPMVAESRRHRLMPWLVPAGIAAAVVIGIMGWVGHRQVTSERLLAAQPMPQGQERIAIVDTEPNLELLEQSIQVITNDDDSSALARLDAKDSVTSGDEISRYLLKLETAH